MAIAVNIPGACLYRSNASGSLADLGYTANGGRIIERQYYGDVPIDSEGGDEGPPGDVQFFGEAHEIHMDLTKYDDAIVDYIRKLGGTLGTPITSGTLLFAGSLTTRLLLLSTSFIRNYTRVLFREPKEHNQGTKFKRLQLTAIAYKDGSGVLWNTTSS